MNDSRAAIRVLVALDESPRSAAALTAAVTLAEELGAELAGLFIEDVNLQHLAGLPFAHEFSLLSGVVHPLSLDDVELTWRREAEVLQQRLADAARRLRLRWSFRVARGKVAAEVSTHARAFDLIVLGRRPGIGIVTMTQTAVASRRSVRVGPVLVLFEDASMSAHSLDLGAALARRSDAELVLLISAGSEDAYRAACLDAQTALQARDAPGRCVWLSALDEAHLIQAARREAAGYLVLANKERFLTRVGFERVLDETECPIVLTR